MKSDLRITVVIPLYDKRVSEEDCLRSWCREQAYPRHLYEVVLISNGEDQAAEARIESFLDEPDRLIHESGANMAGLYHAGALAARSEIIFFTELHCLADPDCLSAMVEYLDRTDLPGACAHSYGDNPNAFASTEAVLFEGMFNDWVKVGSTARKVLLRGFAIRREIYLECGGFVPRYNRLCDGLLGVRLADAGHELGYAEQSTLKHYYSTRYRQFYRAVKESTEDECLFRSENDQHFCDRAFGLRKDWKLRSDFDRKFSRAALGFAVRGALRHRELGLVREILYWGGRAAFRYAPLLVLAWCRKTRLGLQSWWWRKNQGKLLQIYGKAYQSIESFYQLRFLSRYQGRGEMDESLFTEIGSVPDELIAGFHLPETDGEVSFRWSRGVGMIECNLPRRDGTLVIETGSRRGDPSGCLLDLYFNETKITDRKCSGSNGEISVKISAESFRPSMTQVIMTVSRPIPASGISNGDRRVLGLPVVAIRFDD